MFITQNLTSMQHQSRSLELYKQLGLQLLLSTSEWWLKSQFWKYYHIIILSELPNQIVSNIKTYVGQKLLLPIIISVRPFLRQHDPFHSCKSSTLKKKRFLSAGSICCFLSAASSNVKSSLCLGKKPVQPKNNIDQPMAVSVRVLEGHRWGSQNG